MEPMLGVNSEVTTPQLSPGDRSVATGATSSEPSTLAGAGVVAFDEEITAVDAELDRPDRFNLQFEPGSIRIFTEVLDRDGDIVTRIPPASLRTALAAFGLSDGPFSVQSFV